MLMFCFWIALVLWIAAIVMAARELATVDGDLVSESATPSVGRAAH